MIVLRTRHLADPCPSECRDDDAMCKTTSRDLESRPSFLVGVLLEPHAAGSGELGVGRAARHSEVVPYAATLAVIRTCYLFRPSPYTDVRISRDGPLFAARVIYGSSEDRKACFRTNGWFKWDVGPPPGVAMEQLPTRGRSKWESRLSARLMFDNLTDIKGCLFWSRSNCGLSSRVLSDPTSTPRSLLCCSRLTGDEPKDDSTH